jgi:hypothetical protein
MARGTVTPTPLTLNAGTAGTATAVDPVNMHVLVVADGLLRRTLLEVTNSGGTAGTVGIEPGAYPPAFEGFAGMAVGAGTIFVTVPIGGTAFIIVEGAKVIQADGQSVYLDYTPASFQGNVFAFETPLNW